MFTGLSLQQSIREMTRTGRTPQQVMDDAMWGVFAEGWRSGFGADADHLKTPQDIESCVATGLASSAPVRPLEHESYVTLKKRCLHDYHDYTD